MQYTITKMNRTVELDDRLVAEYIKYDDILEHEFVMTAIAKVGHLPTKNEISDEELNTLCTEVLVSNLETFANLPQILQTVEHNSSSITNASKSKDLIELSIFPKEK